jgi:hypothetical protein
MWYAHVVREAKKEVVAEQHIRTRRHILMKTRLAVVALTSLALALPAFSKTHKDTYSNACGEVWAAVKDTLGNPENYTVKMTDEARMTVSYTVKHSAHVSITGALRQRPNTVSLSSKGNGCEMSIESNYSGFEHNDAGDFKKRVDESLAKPKSATASEPAKTEASPK